MNGKETPRIMGDSYTEPSTTASPRGTFYYTVVLWYGTRDDIYATIDWVEDLE